MQKGFRLFLISIVVCCMHGIDCTLIAGDFSAGTAKVNITPDISTSMTGYRGNRYVSGIHDSLYIKALVLDDGRTKFAMVTCDVVWIDRDVAVQARRSVASEFGIPIKQITISATHTHTGLRIIPENLKQHPDKIVDAVRTAIARLQPVDVYTGAGREEYISFNRRFLMRNGTVRFNPPLQSPEIVRAVGPIDPIIGIMYFQTPDGKSVSTWVNFALHLDTVGGTEVSADFPHYLEHVLQRVKGPDMQVMFANGTCGDINHVCRWRPRERFPTRFGKSEQIGHVLAGNIIKEYPALTKVNNPVIAAAHANVPLQVPQYTPAEIEEARAIYAEPFEMTPRHQIAWRKVWTVDYLKRHNLSALPAEVQVLAIGPMACVFLPAEIFVELGLAIKTDSPFQWTSVVELTNDFYYYIPTRKAFQEGSYEVRVAWISPGEGERLVETAVSLLHKLYTE